MPSRAPVSTTHHPQHGHGRPARVEVHTAGGALVRPGQGRATLTPPHHHHHRCLLPPPPLVGLCLYQTVWQRPREPGDIISEKKKQQKHKPGVDDAREAPPCPLPAAVAPCPLLLVDGAVTSAAAPVAQEEKEEALTRRAGVLRRRGDATSGWWW